MSVAQFNNVRRILVIKFKHIGDVLLSVAAVKALKQTFPDASISFLLNSETSPMLEEHPAIDTVFKLDRARGFGYQAMLLAYVRRQRFDMVVDLSGGGDRGALWSFLSGARYRIGTLPSGKQGMAGKRYFYTHVAPTPDVRHHAVIRDLEIVRPFGIDSDDLAVDFVVPPDAQNAVREKLSTQGIAPGTAYAVVHPTSRWLFKCADDRVMGACIDRLKLELGIEVVVTCGPAAEELERLAAILKHCETRPAVFAGNLSLKELGGVLSGAKLYVGVDSAPSHLAAAVNVPSIVLFGPTGAYNWGPWTDAAGEHPYPLEKGVQHAGMHLVLQQDWACVPCGKAGCDDSRVSQCLVQTTPEQVLMEARRILAVAHA